MVNFKASVGSRIFDLIRLEKVHCSFSYHEDDESGRPWYCEFKGPLGIEDINASTLDSMLLQLRFTLGKQRKAVNKG